MSNICLCAVRSADGALLTLSGCVSAAPPSLCHPGGISWRVAPRRHGQASCRASMCLVAVLLGVPGRVDVHQAPASATTPSPSADRDWPFSICSFLSFLSLKLFGETYFLTQPVTQAPTWTLVAIGEDWSRQELTGQGQGRIAPNGSGGSPMSEPACDPQPSDLLTGAWKPLDCTPANLCSST